MMLSFQDNNSFSIAVAAYTLPIHLCLTMCFFYTNLEYAELGVIKPTEYLFEKYNHFGKDKAEIYAEAARHIMSRLSGFPLINTSQTNKLEYMSKIKGKVIKNT